MVQQHPVLKEVAPYQVVLAIHRTAKKQYPFCVEATLFYWKSDEEHEVLCHIEGEKEDGLVSVKRADTGTVKEYLRRSIQTIEREFSGALKSFPGYGVANRIFQAGGEIGFAFPRTAVSIVDIRIGSQATPSYRRGTF